MTGNTCRARDRTVAKPNNDKIANVNGGAKGEYS